MTPFNRATAPQPGEKIPHNGSEKIERVVAYWPDFKAWEVEVLDDRGHRADDKGNPITRMVVGPFAFGAPPNMGPNFWRVKAAR